jgi:flagellar biosynthesis protein FlhF
MATTTQKSPLKTFHGATMADALARVKQDLGPDAVILHTRTFRDGGMLGFGTRDVVEITASTDSNVVRPQRPRPTGHAPRDSGLQPQQPPIHPANPEPKPIPATGPADGFIATPPWFSRAKDGGPAPTPAFGTPARAVARDEPPTSAALPLPTRDHVEPKPMKPPAGVASQPAPPVRTCPTTRVDPRRTEITNTESSSDPAKPITTPMPTQPRRVEATRVAPAPIDSEARSVLDEELAAIRRLVGQVLQSSRRVEARSAQAEAPATAAGPLFDLSLKLLDSQVATEFADEVTGAVRDELAAGELAESATVRNAVLRQIAKRIGVVGDPQPPGKRADGRPSVIALIGPTGVGKTTTVAKLAATCKLRYGKKIGLITADTYRIAAVEQLRTYAEIVGMPLKVVLAPQDISGAIDALAESDTVILDTAGRSQRDDARLDELGEFLKAAEPDQIQLVLSLASAESVIAAAAERYGKLNPDRLLLTKLDEAVDYGVVLNTACRVGLPISFVTTGQEVPDHIEPANAERLARLVLDGGSAWQTIAGGR